MIPQTKRAFAPDYYAGNCRLKSGTKIQLYLQNNECSREVVVKLEELPVIPVEERPSVPVVPDPEDGLDSEQVVRVVVIRPFRRIPIQVIG